MSFYETHAGTHIRYFTVMEDGTKKFRYGGLLRKNTGLPDYVVLTNGRSSWSVQTKNSEFYRKLSLKEIKKEYETAYDELEEKYNKLLDEYKKLKHYIIKKIEK